MPMNGRTIPITDAKRILLVFPEPQRVAIRELGSGASGGSFDPLVMAALYSAGIVTVDGQDRRVKLTRLGAEAYEILSRRQKQVFNELP